MQKPLITLVAATMVVFAASADTEIVDGIEWTFVRSAGESSIFNFSYSSAIPADTSGAIVVPSTLGGCPVTAIGDLAFAACSGLTSVMIPNSVTRIGDSAFVACSGLASVTIPDSVTSIGRYAFAACGGIKSVTVPQSVCSGQLATVFPSSYQAITNVVVSDGVTSIGDNAFSGCRALVGMLIPDGVTSIGEGAFSGCNEALYDTTTIPGVRLVDGWAVGGTDDLAGDLSLVDVRGIVDYAFEESYYLTSVAIPVGLPGIGEGAFCLCEGLTNVTIGSGVTCIGAFAFYGCAGLREVTIPAGVANIGDGAFSDCSGLTNVVFAGNAPSAEDSAFGFVGQDCIATVLRSSTGWGVEEGAQWHGLTIVYSDGADDGLVFEVVDFAVETEVRGNVVVSRMIVGVIAKDGDQSVQGDAGRVAEMFEATSDFGDWDGAAKLTPMVEVLEGDGATMRFRVTPGDGTASSAFLRIRK
ncbi:MAG: leucine-rich repeat domain-containing protein [Kiritimatiellae bacterium]|nr:leucine-rich repeat domain-containing protein [Kiritimatiellia bacterium]